MKNSELIRKAIENVNKGWCQGHYARTAEGLAVSGKNGKAVQWCMQGAFNKVFSEEEGHDIGAVEWNDVVDKIDELVQPQIKPTYLPANLMVLFNDTPGRKKEEVIEVLEEAAKYFESQEKENG
jgi:hypothetical protein